MESNLLINHFCAILGLDVKKRSLSRGQNLSCDECHEVPRISAAAKFGKSAHCADFRKRGGLESLAGHCDQPPIARADPKIAPHLDCWRREQAGAGDMRAIQQ